VEPAEPKLWFPSVDDFISQLELLEPKVVFPTIESHHKWNCQNQKWTAELYHKWNYQNQKWILPVEIQ
jgi:hypothetical protein